MLKPKGIFSASRVADLLAGGTGKTKLNYIFEIAEDMVGVKKEITTKQMQHGLINEINAINILCSKYGGSPNYEKNGQVFYKINDKLGATPDAIGFDWVGDAKCQYTILNFFNQNENLTKKYFIQVQTQMMALRVNKGYLINYLTKPEEWGQDDWVEYPFPVEDRYFVHEIEKDESVQSSILDAVDVNYPLIGVAHQMLESAIIIDEYDFFMMQFKDKIRFVKLKDVNWVNNDKKVYSFNKDFFIKK